MERKPTPFETKVYEALCMVPAGKVVTYKTLGAAVGCKSGQAIGNAMRRNPYAPEVPCHRVIPATLSLGGYSGETTGEKVVKKKRLLEQEGVYFDSTGKLANEDNLLDVIDLDLRG